MPHDFFDPREATRETIAPLLAENWTTDFNFPAFASVVAPNDTTLVCSGQVKTNSDLIGILYYSFAQRDHAYEGSADYTGVRWSLHWKSTNLKGLSAAGAPTMGIYLHGEDIGSNVVYVDLNGLRTLVGGVPNGTDTDTDLVVDFNTLKSGFASNPSTYLPIDPRQIHKIIISMPVVTVPIDFQLVLSNMTTTGKTISRIKVGCEEHEVGIAAGYGDEYNKTPTRVYRRIRDMGYSNVMTLYLGAAQHYSTALNNGRWEVDTTPGKELNPPAKSWLRDLTRLVAADGLRLVYSVSFELSSLNCPYGWRQENAYATSETFTGASGHGEPGETGYSIPTWLIDPCNSTAVNYVTSVLQACMNIGAEYGLIPEGQVGEPWLWDQFTGTQRNNHVGAPCLYGTAMKAAYQVQFTVPMPTCIDKYDLTFPLTAQNWIRDQLGAAVSHMSNTCKAAIVNSRMTVLPFFPTILQKNGSGQNSIFYNINQPVAFYKYGGLAGFDYFQIELYDYDLAGDVATQTSVLNYLDATYGYPPQKTQYFAGVITQRMDALQWDNITQAMERAMLRGYQALLWASTQVADDRYQYLPRRTWPTVEDVITHLSGSGILMNLPDSDTRKRIQSVIDQTTALLERATGRQFVPGSDTRRYDGNGTQMMEIDDFVSLQSVTALSPAGDPVATYAVGYLSPRTGDPSNRFIQLVGVPYGQGFLPGRQNIQAVGVFGFASEVPADVREAVLGQVLDGLRHTVSTGAASVLNSPYRVTGEHAGSESINYETGLLEESMWALAFKAVIDRYKLPPNRRFRVVRTPLK